MQTRAQSTMTSPEPLHHLRVLVVEDVPPLRDLMMLVLRHNRHTVEAAATAGEALLKLQQSRFDIVVSDLSLGSDMTGWDLAGAIRDTWPHVEFVLVTGSAEGISSEWAAKAGVDAVLSKPYRSADLQAVVSRVADSRSS
jgi:CheY-like chemotaxis protein